VATLPLGDKERPLFGLIKIPVIKKLPVPLLTRISAHPVDSRVTIVQTDTDTVACQVTNNKFIKQAIA
jgi:hypothetical protein